MDSCHLFAYGGLRRVANLNIYFQQLQQHGFFKIDIFSGKKNERKRTRQNKLKYDHVSAIIACANKAIVRNKRNHMNNQRQMLRFGYFVDQQNKGFFCFSSNKRYPRDTLGKLRFLNKLFLGNEAQIKKTNYTTMIFMARQVSPPKLSSILQK